MDLRRIEIELELRLGGHKFTFHQSLILSSLVLVLISDQWVILRGSHLLNVGHAKLLFLENASCVPSERMHAIRILHLIIAFPAAYWLSNNQLDA